MFHKILKRLNESIEDYDFAGTTVKENANFAVTKEEDMIKAISGSTWKNEYLSKLEGRRSSVLAALINELEPQIVTV